MAIRVAKVSAHYHVKLMKLFPKYGDFLFFKMAAVDCLGCVMCVFGSP